MVPPILFEVHILGGQGLLKPPVEELHMEILPGSLDPPTLAGSYWKLESPLARSRQTPLGFCTDTNWLSSPQIKKTHSDPGKCIKGGQTLQLPEWGVGGEEGADVGLGMLPASSPDSASRRQAGPRPRKPIRG